MRGPHALHIPGIVLDEVMHGVLEWATLKPLVFDELLFEAFEDMAKKRDCPEPYGARAFGRQWLLLILNCRHVASFFAALATSYF